MSWLLTLSGLAVILVKCGTIPSIRVPVTESSYINISKEETEVGNKDRDRLNDASAANSIGVLKEFQGDDKSALADYDRAINLDPKNDVHYSNRGMFFANSGNTQRALSDYDTAIKINPNNPITYDNRGFLKARIGDSQGALSDYTQAIKIDLNFDPSYNNRAKLYESIGDNKNAINDLKKVAEIYKATDREAEYQQVIQQINNLNIRI